MKTKKIFDGIEYRGSEWGLFWTKKNKECSSTQTRMPITASAFIRFYGLKVLWNKKYCRWATCGVDIAPSLLRKWLVR